METVFDANVLRKPGYYKWYAPEELYKEILAKLNINYEDISGNVERLENNENYFAIYIGIAEGQPIIRRIGHHLYNSFDSSTLRKSIAAVYETIDNNVINNFIDMLKVQLFYETDINLHETEKQLLHAHFYVLNIQGNGAWADKIALLKQRRRALFG